MKFLSTGLFYGNTAAKLFLNEITVTETVYTHEFVDWHYHENAYFTFLDSGKLIEGNKKEKLIYTPQTLLYHNCQEPHFNIKPEGFSKGFHIEITGKWFEDNNIRNFSSKGSEIIQNPFVIRSVKKIINILRRSDPCSDIMLEEYIFEIFEKLSGTKTNTQFPKWVTSIREILHERYNDNISLAEIAHELGIHPVHLSRDFKKYYQCNIGEYIRKLRLQNALLLLKNNSVKLTEIAYLCGFSDQSHFLRWFKNFTGYSPSAYKKKFSLC